MYFCMLGSFEKSMYRKFEKILLIALVVSLTVGCDQTTKRVAEKTLKGAAVKSMLRDTVRLQYVENTGAFLGFGSRFPAHVKFWTFLMMPIAMLLGMLLFGLYSRKITRWQLMFLMMAVGGGVSNLIDRVFLNGRVTDFLNMGIGSLRTGIFNIADVAIMFGMFGLVFMQSWAVEEEEVWPAHIEPDPYLEFETPTWMEQDSTGRLSNK